MIKLKDLLSEVYNSYDFGCVMLDFDFPALRTFQRDIEPKDVYGQGTVIDTYGIVEEHHCTLLYGLHGEVTLKQVKDVLGAFEYGTYVAHNASLFQQKEYDVFKFEIKGPNLKKINKALRKLPHTSTFKDYKPHMTIAYLKPGKGKKYVDLFEGLSYSLLPVSITYSRQDGFKHIIDIA